MGALVRRVFLKVRHLFLVPVLLIAIWWLIAESGKFNPVFLPSPANSVKAAIEYAEDGKLFSDIAYTVTSTVIGWGIGIGIGVILALAVSFSDRVLAALMPSFDFARSVPSAALIPAATLILGFGRSMEVPIIAFTTIWPVFLNVVHGLRHVEPRLKDVAAVLEFTRWQRITKFNIPATLPEFFLGARTALSVGIIVAVIAEMVGGTGGLGATIILSGQTFDGALVYALVVVLGIIGVLANTSVTYVERYALRYRRAHVQ